MENASKALIIAGAILLAILLVSLGIMVYNNAKGTVSDASLASEEAQTFNTKISQYCGNNKSATDMNSLVDAIAASNGAQTRVASGERHVVSIKINNAAGGSASSYVTGSSVTVDADNVATTSYQYPSFANGTTYTASYKTDSSGYINEVSITPAQ